MAELPPVIHISDDSSSESDAALDSDSHSSPESLADDDVVLVEPLRLPAEERGEPQGQPEPPPPSPGAAPSGTARSRMQGPARGHR